MTHPAVIHQRPAPKRTRRLSKVTNARDTLAGFGHGMELDCLTFGQFSIMDAVEAILDTTGPSDVAISTWTAAAADLSRTAQHLRDERIRSLRMVVDRSFLTRQPDYAKLCIELFGPDAIRTTRVHAKFVLIRNAEWAVTIRTSMNLNDNPRLEYLQVCDDSELCEWYTQIVDELFAQESPGLEGARGAPDLANMASLPGSRTPITVSPMASVKVGPE